MKESRAGRYPRFLLAICPGVALLALLAASRAAAEPLEEVRSAVGAASGAGEAAEAIVAWPQLKPSEGTAFRDASHVYFYFERLPAGRKVRLPRLNNPVAELAILGAKHEAPRLAPTPREWQIELPATLPADKPLVLAIKTVGEPVVPLEPQVVRANREGTFVLPAHQAVVHGEKLCYEPLPHKNTLGYWVNADDWAEWHLEFAGPGHYKVEIAQGCGGGQGGSTVEIGLGDEKLEFTVEETGGFQNFKSRELGTVAIGQAGRGTLTLRVKRKARDAVMDVREMRLVPVAQ